nr:ribonuclease H-like domain-containing protein [Tanacetum cinerariifolium]
MLTAYDRKQVLLSDYQEYDGGFVAFAGSSRGGKITGKGKIRTGKLDFEDVYFVKELKFNLFSVSQMCDKKNSVLFTETKCLILSLDFKLPDENQVLLKVHRKNNMYSFDLKNVVPSKVTILNTLDHLGKFDGKADEGFLVGYSINIKAFRVYNSRTKKVEENLHVNFLENKPNVAGSGSPIHSDVGQKGKEKVSDQEYILLPVLNTSSNVPSSNEDVESSPKDDARKNFNTASLTVNTASDKDGTFQRTYGELKFSTPILVNASGSSFSHPVALDDFSKMPNLKDTEIFDDAYDDRDEGAEADYNNLEIVITGHRQEEGIDYDEVFAPIARIEAIRKGTIDKTLFIKKIKNDILLVQVYVDDIIFGSTKRLSKEKMAYFLVRTMKRIIRYLKGHPTLGLWYPKDLPLDLIAYSDSDYAGASPDRKSITGCCQFLCSRLIF